MSSVELLDCGCTYEDTTLAPLYICEKHREEYDEMKKRTDSVEEWVSSCSNKKGIKYGGIFLLAIEFGFLIIGIICLIRIFNE